MPLSLGVWQLPSEDFSKLGAPDMNIWLALGADRTSMRLPRDLHAVGHRHGSDTLAYRFLKTTICFFAYREPAGNTSMRKYYRPNFLVDIAIP